MLMLVSATWHFRTSYRTLEIAAIHAGLRKWVKKWLLERLINTKDLAQKTDFFTTSVVRIKCDAHHRAKPIVSVTSSDTFTKT